MEALNYPEVDQTELTDLNDLMFAGSSSEEEVDSNFRLEIDGDSARNIMVYEIIANSELDFDKKVRETMRRIFQPDDAWFMTEQEADELSNSLLTYLNDNPIEGLYDPVDDEQEEEFLLKKYLVLKMEIDAINDGENVVEI